MLIIRKKNIIRLVSFLLGALLVIVGLYFRGYQIEKKQKNDRIKLLSSCYSSVCSYLDNICTAFDNEMIFNEKTKASREIYSNCNSANNSLYYCDVDMPNTVSWFSNLAEYSETDMSDSALNDYYAKTAEEARNIFITLCNNVENTSPKETIEKLLDSKDEDFYKKQLEAMNNSYPILDNFSEMDRSDLNDHAKKILNFPLSPQKTKGNYSNPPLFLFSCKNSYAQIFSAGGFLKRMSIEETSTVKHSLEKTFDELALDYLNKYAPYAKKCEFICCYKNNELIYYVFCPVIKQNEIDFLDCTQSIKLAISISDGKLMAFDASHFMETCSNTEYPKCLVLKNTNISTLSEKTQLISYGIIYTKKGFYYYSKHQTNNNSFYLIYDSDGNSRFYSERKFLLMSGII